MSLCAVLMPMTGVEWQWLAGHTNSSTSACDITCAPHKSRPCYQLAGRLDVAIPAGLEALFVSIPPVGGLPVSCACTCQGSTCNKQDQEVTASWGMWNIGGSGNCRYPGIQPCPASTTADNAQLSAEAATAVASSSVYRPICRSEGPSTKGLMGWVDESIGATGSQANAVCRIAWSAPSADFQVLCTEQRAGVDLARSGR